MTDPHCNCSLGWRFRKGHGPDPARCPAHGEITALVNAPAEDETTPAYLQARRGSESEGAETDE